jgi:hypothetical protein
LKHVGVCIKVFDYWILAFTCQLVINTSHCIRAHTRYAQC